MTPQSQPRALRLALAPSHGPHYQSSRPQGLVETRVDADARANRQKAAIGGSGAGPAPPARLAEIIESYLADHPSAALLEDGRAAFDMRTAHYSVGESHGRCLLEVWSEERNLVRTVVDAHERAQCLRLVTRRMGTAKPQTLELVPTSDRRTPTARDTARRNYMRLLERVLSRQFIGAKVDGMRTAMDLEHSFGPAYARGRLLKGSAADAVIGVGDAESGIDDRRRPYSGNPVARLLPQPWRRAAPLRRPESRGSRGNVAHYSRADGVAQSLDRGLSIIHARRTQRGTGGGRLSRHRQFRFATRPCIFFSSSSRTMPIRHRSPARARSQCGARAGRDPSAFRDGGRDCWCTALSLPGYATAHRHILLRARMR